jgi:hypothetical protein
MPSKRENIQGTFIEMAEKDGKAVGLTLAGADHKSLLPDASAQIAVTVGYFLYFQRLLRQSCVAI